MYVIEEEKDMTYGQLVSDGFKFLNSIFLRGGKSLWKLNGSVKSEWKIVFISKKIKEKQIVQRQWGFELQKWLVF